MKKQLLGFLLLTAFFCANAKPTDALCENTQTEKFEHGKGTFFEPYLICNTKQLAFLSKNTQYLKYFYRLGADLSFKNKIFHIIGSSSTPFTGGFDGDNYTLANINLDTHSMNTHVAPFAFIKNARLENLNVYKIKLSNFVHQVVGGMVGEAVSSTLFNLHLKKVDLTAPDSSGGLIGILTDSNLSDSSVKGKLRNHFGTDASGGLVGSCSQSKISSSFSNIKITNSSKNPFGVSFIGGLVGGAIECSIDNVYASGNIDYSRAETDGPRYVGGLLGVIIQSEITNAYYAGKIKIKGQFIGGAIGARSNSSVDGVFWDKELSGINDSDGGIPEITIELQRRSFWIKHHFSERVWHLIDGKYPDLIFDQ